MPLLILLNALGVNVLLSVDTWASFYDMIPETTVCNAENRVGFIIYSEADVSIWIYAKRGLSMILPLCSDER